MQDKTYWETQLKRLIAQKDITVDVDVGPVYDLFIRPVAGVLDFINKRVEYVKKITDFSRIVEWSDDDVDLFAQSYGVKRKSGTKAVCIATFYALRRPTVEIFIPRGALISTVRGLRFVTADSLRVPVNQLDQYRNLMTGRYEFPVKVECEQYGAKGNVAAGTIVVPVTLITGIDGVINKVAAYGGSDRESNDMLVSRVLDVIRGAYSIGNIGGLRLSVLDNFPRVMDCIVERDNPLLPGTIDLCFKGEDLKQVTEPVYWFGLDVVPSKRPVLEVTKVWSGNVEYQKDVDWLFVPDVTSVYRGTSLARDRIVWLSGNRPVMGSEVWIEYIYNSLPEQLEDWHKYEWNKVIEPRVWFRYVTVKDVKVKLQVKLYQGYGEEVFDSIRELLVERFAQLPLGVSVQVSDVIGWIRSQVAGVDDVKVLVFSADGSDTVTDLQAKYGESFRLLDENIIIERR